MNMFRVFLYGLVAYVGISLAEGATVTVADQCILIYLAMILGASVSIIRILEKRR